MGDCNSNSLFLDDSWILSDYAGLFETVREEFGQVARVVIIIVVDMAEEVVEQNAHVGLGYLQHPMKVYMTFAFSCCCTSVEWRLFFFVGDRRPF